MRVLLLGLSSIGERRVLPALAKTAAISSIDIASRSKPQPIHWQKQGVFFDDYAQAIAKSEADLIYVSLPNSAHVEWILSGLGSGRHVVVDKPATLTLPDAERCSDAAVSGSLLLAEATVFSYHSQFAAMLAFLPEIGPLSHIDAHFVIPPLPLANFRNHRALGGGCLQDMGPYAAVVARLFGLSEIERLHAFAAPFAPDRDVDMGFSFLAQFGNGVRYSGHFSFEGEYQNRLFLIGQRGSLAVERVFSMPSDLPPIWQVRMENKVAERAQPPSDAFQGFFDRVGASLATGDYSGLLHDLLKDAAFRSRLIATLDSWRCTK